MPLNKHKGLTIKPKIKSFFFVHRNKANRHEKHESKMCNPLIFDLHRPYFNAYCSSVVKRLFEQMLSSFSGIFFFLVSATSLFDYEFDCLGWNVVLVRCKPYYFAWFQITQNKTKNHFYSCDFLTRNIIGG